MPDDCTACGACCFAERYDYIRVFNVDAERMGPEALALTRQVGNERYLRFENGRCAALIVDPDGRSCRCAIYAVRPDCCRWLERGSGTCQEQLAEKKGLVGLAR